MQISLGELSFLPSKWEASETSEPSCSRRQMLRDDQPVLSIERHAVKMARWSKHDLAADARHPLHHLVADDIDVIEPLIPPVPDRSLAEHQAAYDLHQGRIGIRDLIHAWIEHF